MKVLKLNQISPAADPPLRGYEYSDAVQNPDAILLRSFSMHDYPLGESLLAVARAGAGVNNIPVEKCTERGIVVFNTPGANANAVKELVLCELFLGGRKILEGSNWVQSLKGRAEIEKTVEREKSRFAGAEIYGKTLGVLGLGAIGTAVANAAVALGMRVIGFDPFFSVKNALLLDSRVQIAAVQEEVFPAADYLTLHLPFTPQTKGLLNGERLAACKEGVVIVNDSRGELADNAAVAEGIESGRIARYITDFPCEELLGLENVVCIPHLGASTPEAEDNCARMAAEELTDYLENGNIRNSVNYPSLSMPRTSPCRICVHHKNVKEMLAKMLSVVSSYGVNVAHMQDLSRGEYAYLMLDLDEKPGGECAAALRALEGVIRIRVL